MCSTIIADLYLQMILNHDLHLPLDTIVTVWISSKNVRAVADAGYRIIHAVSSSRGSWNLCSLL